MFKFLKALSLFIAIIFVMGIVVFFWGYNRHIEFPDMNYDRNYLSLSEEAPQRGANAFDDIWLLDLKIPKSRRKSAMEADQRSWLKQANAIKDNEWQKFMDEKEDPSKLFAWIPPSREAFKPLFSKNGARFEWCEDAGKNPQACVDKINANELEYAQHMKSDEEGFEKIFELANFKRVSSPFSDNKFTVVRPDYDVLRRPQTLALFQFQQKKPNEALDTICKHAQAVRVLVEGPDSTVEGLAGADMMREDVTILSYILARSEEKDIEIPASCGKAFAPFKSSEIWACRALKKDFTMNVRAYFKTYPDNPNEKSKNRKIDKLALSDLIKLETLHYVPFCSRNASQLVKNDERFSLDELKAELGYPLFSRLGIECFFKHKSSCNTLNSFMARKDRPFNEYQNRLLDAQFSAKVAKVLIDYHEFKAGKLKSKEAKDERREKSPEEEEVAAKDRSATRFFDSVEESHFDFNLERNFQYNPDRRSVSFDYYAENGMKDSVETQEYFLPHSRIPKPCLECQLEIFANRVIREDEKAVDFFIEMETRKLERGDVTIPKLRDLPLSYRENPDLLTDDFVEKAAQRMEERAKARSEGVKVDDKALHTPKVEEPDLGAKSGRKARVDKKAEQKARAKKAAIDNEVVSTALKEDDDEYDPNLNRVRELEGKSGGNFNGAAGGGFNQGGGSRNSNDINPDNYLGDGGSGQGAGRQGTGGKAGANANPRNGQPQPYSRDSYDGNNSYGAQGGRNPGQNTGGGYQPRSSNPFATERGSLGSLTQAPPSRQPMNQPRVGGTQRGSGNGSQGGGALRVNPLDNGSSGNPAGNQAQGTSPSNSVVDGGAFSERSGRRGYNQNQDGNAGAPQTNNQRRGGNSNQGNQPNGWVGQGQGGYAPPPRANQPGQGATARNPNQGGNSGWGGQGSQGGSPSNSNGGQYFDDANRQFQGGSGVGWHRDN